MSSEARSRLHEVKQREGKEIKDHKDRIVLEGRIDHKARIARKVVIGDKTVLKDVTRDNDQINKGHHGTRMHHVLSNHQGILSNQVSQEKKVRINPINQINKARSLSTNIIIATGPRVQDLKVANHPNPIIHRHDL